MYQVLAIHCFRTLFTNVDLRWWLL